MSMVNGSPKHQSIECWIQRGMPHKNNLIGTAALGGSKSSWFKMNTNLKLHQNRKTSKAKSSTGSSVSQRNQDRQSQEGFPSDVAQRQHKPTEISRKLSHLKETRGTESSSASLT